MKGSFLLLAIYAVALAAATTQQNGTILVTGRYQVSSSLTARTFQQSVISFDFSGVSLNLSFSLPPGFAVDVSILLSQRVSSVANASQPHRFIAFLNNEPILSDNTVQTPTHQGEYLALDTANLTDSTFVNFLLLKNLRNENASITHYVLSVLSLTEPDYNNPYYEANYVSCSGFNITNHAQKSEALLSRFLPAPTADRRTIEFIGDSLTAGFANLCEQKNPPLPPGYAQESYAASWANIVCNAFGALCNVEAWSGFGMIRNYCQCGDTQMPEVLQRTIGSLPGSTWNFSLFVPDVVVINLGSNDFANPVNSTFLQLYVEEYIRVVYELMAVYGHGTTFFLACGPATEKNCPQVMEVIRTVSKRGKTIFLDQRGLMANRTLCYGHPSSTIDKVIAAATFSQIKKAMGW